MKLVTYQLLNSSVLKTAIQISQYELLDIVDEASARGSDLNVNTMLDIIDGGAPVMNVLREIEKAPRSKPIMLNTAILKAPIPRPRKNVFCVGWNYLEHFQEGATTLQDGREIPKWPVFFPKRQLPSMGHLTLSLSMRVFPLS